MTKSLIKAALDYHSCPMPGKISIAPTKSTYSQDELALCYTPGVAEPCKAIAAHPDEVYHYTSKGNLIAVITNGTAVLGLGNIGPLASKPVMEGKSVLFKLLADIDVFDIEIDSEDPEALIETIIRIAPTFGGINLEDIKAPECFVVEQALKEKLNLPVFHDDQHGTAIVISAGLLNALEIQKKELHQIKIVCAGAGAAGIATMNLLMKLGVPKENLILVDRNGTVHSERHDLNPYKQTFAIKMAARTLSDAVQGADVFIGVSGPDILSETMLQSMAQRPIVFALSNPVPEIMPEIAYHARPDLLMATGRSDYPNQVNNALCFPYIFRGALDIYASTINEAMQLAAVHAIKDLTREPVTQEVLEAYRLSHLEFGPNYILPKLLDRRLKSRVSEAVAKAAIVSGVAKLQLSTISQV